jgi:hypothetical protein
MWGSVSTIDCLFSFYFLWFNFVLLCVTRLVAGLSPRRPGFAPGSIPVGFVVDKVALGRFSPSSSVSPAKNIIPPLLHIHLS